MKGQRLYIAKSCVEFNDAFLEIFYVHGIKNTCNHWTILNML